MKLLHSIVAASAVLAIAPAALGSEDAARSCAALQQQFDKEVASTQSDRVGEAQSLREQGGQLCAAGRNDEGAAKIKEALTLIKGAPAPKTS